MSTPRIPSLTTLEALMALANCPDNGYVFMRYVTTTTTGKIIKAKHQMCWFHFAGWATHGAAIEGRATPWRELVLEDCASRMERGQFEIIRVSDYDGKHRSACPYCTQKRLTHKYRSMFGDKLYRNGPDNG